MREEIFEPVDELPSPSARRRFVKVLVFSLLAIGFIISRSEKPSFVPRHVQEAYYPPDQNVSSPYTPADIFQESYPGYPDCDNRVQWLIANWNATKANTKYYSARGIDGSVDSMLDFLNQHGLFCPSARDRVKHLIRGVNIGGWLVLEPWIAPSLFEQFDPALDVKDQWTFCKTLGKTEARRQLEKHWDTWLSETDVKTLAESGINHVRIPVGYWIMGDIRDNEPWVGGELRYLQRAMLWFKHYNISVAFDLHCAPGSQNGFDNSGRFGPIRWGEASVDAKGRVFYPNLDRSLTVIEGLVSVFSLTPFAGTVRYIELVNEAFVSIPLTIVKDYYLRGYKAVRNIDPNIGIVIGDSFRFQAWEEFMYPPEYNHVYIDTHIYQVFDAFRLSQTPQQHIDQTCNINLPQVAVAPLSTIVGEWSAAMTDCAKWLNGYGKGARFDGNFANTSYIGSCEGLDDPDSARFSREYVAHMRKFVHAQMEAYETGSALGWFFWNFKTEVAPQWNYLLGLERGWIPKQSERVHVCTPQK